MVTHESSPELSWSCESLGSSENVKEPALRFDVEFDSLPRDMRLIPLVKL